MTDVRCCIDYIMFRLGLRYQGYNKAGDTLETTLLVFAMITLLVKSMVLPYLHKILFIRRESKLSDDPPRSSIPNQFLTLTCYR